MRRWWLTAAALVALALGEASPAVAAIHYVQQGGTATWAQSAATGTPADSLTPCSMATMNAGIRAGEVAQLLSKGGAFTTAIRPDSSGTSGSRITIMGSCAWPRAVVVAGVTLKVPGGGLITSASRRYRYITVKWMQTTGDCAAGAPREQTTGAYYASVGDSLRKIHGTGTGEIGCYGWDSAADSITGTFGQLTLGGQYNNCQAGIDWYALRSTLKDSQITLSGPIWLNTSKDCRIERSRIVCTVTGSVNIQTVSLYNTQGLTCLDAYFDLKNNSTDANSKTLWDQRDSTHVRMIRDTLLFRTGTGAFGPNSIFLSNSGCPATPGLPSLWSSCVLKSEVANGTGFNWQEGIKGDTVEFCQFINGATTGPGISIAGSVTADAGTRIRHNTVWAAGRHAVEFPGTVASTIGASNIIYANLAPNGTDPANSTARLTTGYTRNDSTLYFAAAAGDSTKAIYNATSAAFVAPSSYGARNFWRSPAFADSTFDINNWSKPDLRLLSGSFAQGAQWADGYVGALGTGTAPPVDATAPGTINDLSATAGDGSVLLTWTAPGDDGNTGTATSYDVRYSTSTITSGNWSSATSVTGEPTPLLAGLAQSMTVTGLANGTTYYFAITADDEVPNTSALSNVPSGTPTAPAAPGQRYVTTTGAGSHAGTSLANAWTMAEANAQAVAGDIVQVYPGNYPTAINPTNDGDASARITYKGPVSGDSSVVVPGIVLSRSNLTVKWLKSSAAVTGTGLTESDSLIGVVVRSSGAILTFTGDLDNMVLSGVTGSSSATGDAARITLSSSLLTVSLSVIPADESDFMDRLTMTDCSFYYTGGGTSASVGSPAFVMRYVRNPAFTRCRFLNRALDANNPGASAAFQFVQFPAFTDCAWRTYCTEADGNQAGSFVLSDSTHSWACVRDTMELLAGAPATTNGSGDCYTLLSSQNVWASGADNHFSACVFKNQRRQGVSLRYGSSGYQFIGCTIVSTTEEALRLGTDAFSTTPMGPNLLVIHNTIASINGPRAIFGGVQTANSGCIISQNIYYAGGATSICSSSNAVEGWLYAGSATTKDSCLVFDPLGTAARGLYKYGTGCSTPGTAADTIETHGRWGTPAFADSAFLTFDGTLTNGSYAAGSQWRDGYVGAVASQTIVPLTAAFTQSASTILEGGTITMTDATTGGPPTSWLWSIRGGDGNGWFDLSEDQHPTFTVPTSGSYSSELNVTDAAGDASSATSSFTVTAIRPKAVSDLLAVQAGTTAATLSWTSVGDDSLTGTATEYDIRMSTATITSGNWDSATQLSGEPAPAAVGVPQYLSVGGLTEATNYYFAMKVYDEGANPSALSNVDSTRTLSVAAPVTAITLDSLGIVPLRNMLGVTAYYSGDDDADATARLFVKPSAVVAYDSALTMTRISGRRFVGVIVRLNRDSLYDVRADLTDPDGGSGTLAEKTRTQADRPRAVSGRQWWVSSAFGTAGATGADSASAISTVAEAVSRSSAGDQIRVLPGTYYESVIVSKGGTFAAPYSIVGHGAGVHFYGNDATLETGATWTAATAGTYGANTYYLAGVTTEPMTVVADSTQRLHRKVSASEMLNGVNSITQGFYWEVGTQRLYVHLEGNDSPASHTMRIAKRDYGLWVTASNVRVDSLDFRYYGSGGTNWSGNAVLVGVYNSPAHGVTVRNCTAQDVGAAFYSNRGSNYNVFENCTVADDRVWTFGYYGGKNRAEERVGGFTTYGIGDEVFGCTVSGVFNGISVPGDSLIESASKFVLIAHNAIANVADDGIEEDLTCGVGNVLGWNTITRAANGISMAPIMVGPSFAMFNRIVDVENGGGGFKLGDGAYGSSLGVKFFYNNTVASTMRSGGAYPVQATFAVHGVGGVYKNLTCANNVFGAGGYGQWLEGRADGDSTTISFNYDRCDTMPDNFRGVRWKSLDWPSFSIRGFTASASYPGFGWENNGTFGRPAFVDTANGDYRIPTGSAAKNAAKRIPGVNVGWSWGDSVYLGLPDAGAYERDESPPAAVTTVAARASAENAIRVTFTMTGDDSLTGTATSYQVRYSTAPITSANWSSATSLGTVAADAPGTAVVVQATDLSRNTLYYFAVRVTDDYDNQSALLSGSSASASTFDRPAIGLAAGGSRGIKLTVGRGQ